MPSPSPEEEKPTRSPLAPAAGLLIVAEGTLAYHNSLDGAFVFDDLPAIRDNATIRSLWPLRDALSPPENSGVGGRPLANLSFAVNRALTGPGVRGFHAGNLLLHLGSALLLFGIVRRAQISFGARQNALPLAFAAALLWVVHPLTTGAVSWISQRTELLMAFCYLATLYAFIRGTEASGARWFILSALACACGMSSKEVMVTAPFMVLLYDRTLVAGTFRAAWTQRSRYYLALASTWLVLGWLLATSALSQRSVGFGLGVAPLTYALTECRALLIYLKLALWPSPLIFDYGAVYSGSALVTATGATLLVGALAWTVRALRRQTALGFAAGCFFLLLAPTSSLVPVAEQPIAENRMYLPLAVIVATLVTAVFLATGSRLLKALPAFAAAFGILIFARNVDYRSEISLWADTAQKRPQNSRAHYNHGIALLDAGQPARAFASFERAIALKPTEPKAHNSLGNALLELGRPADALPHFAEAVRLDPRYALAWHNLAVARQAIGNLHFQMNQPAEAMAHYQAALHIDPTLADSHYNAGSASLELGRLDDAIAYFTAAARLKPTDAEIRNNLGAALLRAGRAAAAIAAFEHALRLKPDYTDARDNLTLARAQAGGAR